MSRDVLLRHRPLVVFAALLIALGSPPAMAQLPTWGSDGTSLGGPLGSGLGFGGGTQHATFSAEFSQATAEQPAYLMVTGRMQPGWHIGSLTQVSGGPLKTKIEIPPSGDFRLIGSFRPDPEPKVYVDQVAFVGVEVQEHHDRVTWYAPIELSPGVDPASLEIHGQVTGQVCNDVCILFTEEFTARLGQDAAIQPPTTDARFAADAVSTSATATSALPEITAAEESLIAATMPSLPVAYDLSRVVVQGDEVTASGPSGQPAGSGLLYYVLLAFAGGLILNLMPCVLPVIGLKVMSFVDQAGHSRAQALMLNIWYAAGIVAVFLVLAIAAIAAGLTWGGQFGSTTFNVILVSLVFAMALSLLGVWEIPIPGFFGSGRAQDLASQEGPLGAFLKGCVTTVLATPCTAPLMATAAAWAVSQPAWSTLAVFTSLGVGMASPFLLIGAFPGLIRFVPKPGAWMETFKQIMGFILLGTVVYILSFLELSAVVPTVLMLTGVGLACWVLSRTPLTAPSKDRRETWALAGAVLLLAAVLSYGWLHPVMAGRLDRKLAQAGETATADQMVALLSNLRAAAGEGRLAAALDDAEANLAAVSDDPWQSFSLRKLAQAAVRDGRTVMVDFSADWCANCQVLEATVLHTDDVEHAVDDLDIVTMYADFTDYPLPIRQTLEALGSNGVPVIAIFPGDDPYRPIVFRGGYTRSGLLEAMQRATSPAGGTAGLGTIPVEAAMASRSGAE